MYVSSADVEERAREQASHEVPIAANPALKNVLLCKKTYVDTHNNTVYEGEFKTLVVEALPSVVEELFVVTKWGEGQGNAFRQEIKIFDPAGSLEIFSSRYLEQNFSLQSFYHEHMIIGRASGILLPGEGRYRMEIYLDGRIKSKTYFNVAVSGTEETLSPRENEKAAEEISFKRSSFPFPIPVPLPIRASLNYLRFAKD
jgi:hypothetical protein